MHKSIFILLCFLSIFDLILSKKNRTMLNATNILNITEIRKEIKNNEKQYMDLFAKSSKNEQLFCDKVQNNIKSLQKIKKKFVQIETNIDKGSLNSLDMKEFLEMRSDISFSIVNIDIIIKKLQQKKKSCVNNLDQFEAVKETIKAKNSKEKEKIIKNINHFLKINDEL